MPVGSRPRAKGLIRIPFQSRARAKVLGECLKNDTPEERQSCIRRCTVPKRTGTRRRYSGRGRIGLEFPMRPTRAVMAAVLLLLGTGVASAADQAQLAEAAAFFPVTLIGWAAQPIPSGTPGKV